MLTAKETAKLLDVNETWVYRHKHALGAFQLMPGGAVRFPENRIEQIRSGVYALPNAERKMESNPDDSGSHKNKNFCNQNGSKKMGDGTKQRNMGRGNITDTHGLLA